MKQLFLLFVLCFSFLTFGQQRNSQTVQDSVQLELEKQSADMLIELSNELRSTEPKKALTHAQNAYALSKKNDYNQGIIPSTILLGILHRDAKNYKRAARYLNEAIEAARLTENQTAELRGLKILQEVYRLDKRQKRLAETEIEYKKLQNLLDLNRKASQLSGLEKAYNSKVSALRRSESERENIQEALEQTEEERLTEEAKAARLAQEKAELEVKTLQMEKEAAQNALAISEQEKSLLTLDGQLQRQRFWQVILIAGLAAAILIIVLLIRFNQLKRASEEQQRQARQQLETQEKMATLGQLSAGIAHEIKNPLNFVNNFAVGSSEIVEEIEEYLQDTSGHLAGEHLENVEELIAELKQNALDIHSNGQRIDRIVNSMMEHARDTNGELEWIDINDLVKENLNLAYLGFRALNPAFQANIEEQYDSNLQQVQGISQDLGRVLINMVNNACFTLDKKQKVAGEEYSSVLTISTQAQNEEVLISIRDNGSGILPSDRKKIFTPFFTTKPTGEGNAGLGLSISYDIIVQQYQGNIEVKSEPGEFTEFIISLPSSQENKTKNIAEQSAP